MTDILKINRGGPTKLNFPSKDTSGYLGQAYQDPRSENFFEFRDVCKAFDERLVLDHVSFTVKQGETCVIMGRSGVGKSVTLKHIMGFLKADAGRVIVDGEDVTNYTEAQSPWYFNPAPSLTHSPCAKTYRFLWMASPD